MNASVIQFLDLYVENGVESTLEGCRILMNFSNILTIWFLNYHQPSLENHETKSLSQIITVAIDSCLQMRKMLNKEMRTIPCQRLIDSINHIIFIATGFIMKLFKRRRPTEGIYKSEKDLALHLLQDLISKMPEVVSLPVTFKKPIQHIIVEKHLKAKMTWSDEQLFTDTDICELLVDVIKDLDVTDNDRNTLLITLAKLLHSNYSKKQLMKIPSIVNAINLLINHGAYIYAGNNENKTVIDYIEDCVKENETNEDTHKLLDLLQRQIPSLQSLAAMKAKELSEVGAVPETIKQFLDMH